MQLIHRVVVRETMGTAIPLNDDHFGALQEGKVTSYTVSIVRPTYGDEILIEKSSTSETPWDFMIKGRWLMINPAKLSELSGKTIKMAFDIKNDYFNIKVTAKEIESVNHPSHYNTGKFEVIDVIHDWKLGFNLGNSIKYIARAGHKDKNKYVEDLNKAIFYIQDEIKRHVEKEDLKDVQKDLK